MSNTLGNLIGPIYDTLTVVNREMVGFIPAVTRDNEDFTRAAVGQTVRSFIAPAAAAYDIVPAMTPPNDGDNVFGSMDITIDKAKYVPIKWNGEEILALSNNGANFNQMQQQQFAQAFRTLVNAMEVDIAYKAALAASRASGTPGVAPFGVANDLTDFAQSAQILDDNGAPMGDRSLVVNSAAMVNLRGKQAVLFKTNEAGTDDLLRRGRVGAVEGFGVGFSPATQPMVAGTGANYVVGGTSTLPVGTVMIPIASGTGTINPGDVVQFAGDTRNYVVAGFSGGILAINRPGLRQALPAGASVTVGSTYRPNLAFTRDALLLATRPPARPINTDGTPGDMADDATLITDPFSGITFELSVYKGYRQIRWEIAVVWGTAATNPEHIALLRG